MATHVVTATNWATAVENKIHDDEVARRYGFGGGLVPGVTLYAYVTRAILNTWGREWLERGYADVRFVSPVYDGELVTATVDEGHIELRNATGAICVTGEAGLSDAKVDVPVTIDVPVPASRPPADESSLTPGTDLTTIVHGFHAAKTEEYLSLVGDDLDLYRGPRAVAHPGWLLLDANDVLVQSVALGPWIHVGSRVQNLRPVVDGDEVRTSARVTANFERKGHRLVELDVVTTANAKPASVVHHTAIWRVRARA